MLFVRVHEQKWQVSEWLCKCVFSTRRRVHSSVTVSSLNSSLSRHQSASGGVSGTSSTRSCFHIGTSTIIGFSVTAIILFSYWPLSAMSRRLDQRPALKLLFEDSVFLVLTWSNLLLWRGSWNLCIRLFLPPDGAAGPALGAWVSHALGTVGLMTLQAFNTVGLHGIERDGSYSGGSGVFAISYLREIMPTSCLVSIITW